MCKTSIEMEKEIFPSAAFLLMVINSAIFILFLKDISFFIYSFGFIPSLFRPHTLFTYMFIHANIYHLIFNLIMLLALGFALEKTLGKIFFLLIYFSSGFIAVSFDVIGRILFSIPVDLPLVGSSGSIFGLLAVAALLKPFEKIPTFFILLNTLPFLLWAMQFQIFQNPLMLTLLIFVFYVIFCFILIFKTMIPILYTFLFYLLLWFLLMILSIEEPLSYYAHIGGTLGGIISFFLFARKE